MNLQFPRKGVEERRKTKKSAILARPFIGKRQRKKKGVCERARVGGDQKTKREFEDHQRSPKNGPLRRKKRITQAEKVKKVPQGLPREDQRRPTRKRKSSRRSSNSWTKCVEEVK